MQRRQQMPFNWMSSGQMNSFQRSPYHPMMYSQRGSMRQTRQMRRRNQMGQGQMGQMNQMGQMSQWGSNRQSQRRQGGGLLAKILGKSNPNPTPGGFPGMYPITRGGATTGGGSLLKSFTDPAAISSFLNNTQQVLQAAKQISPIISQYGPLIRNFPALWKLYRGLKDATNQSTEHESSNESSSSKKLSSREESSSTEESSSSSSSSSSSTDESNTRRSSSHHSRKNASKKKQASSSYKAVEDFDLDDIDIIPFDSQVESEEYPEDQLQTTRRSSRVSNHRRSSPRSSSSRESNSQESSHRGTSNRESSSQEFSHQENNNQESSKREYHHPVSSRRESSSQESSHQHSTSSVEKNNRTNTYNEMKSELKKFKENEDRERRSFPRMYI